MDEVKNQDYSNKYLTTTKKAKKAYDEDMSDSNDEIDRLADQGKLVDQTIERSETLRDHCTRKKRRRVRHKGTELSGDKPKKKARPVGNIPEKDQQERY
jgi:hypothetical protein